jgi:hypothetical protein
MTWTSTLALCAASSAIVAAPLLFRLSVARRELTMARARLDLIHDQHVEAGKKAHEAERTKRAETTRALALRIGRPDLAERINDPLDAGPCSHPANRPARAAFGSSAPLSHSCRGSAARKPEGSGGIPEHADRTGGGELPPLTQRIKAGNPSGPVCRRNLAVESIPAEITMKGA